MKLIRKPSANRSLLDLNIGLIEETSQPLKYRTPKQASTENNPQKLLKSVSSQLNLFKSDSSRDKLHTQFTKY